MKSIFTLSTVALATQAWAASCSPTREIGGVKVIDTPIVRAAEEYAKNNSNDAVYAHIMRSWLYGVLYVQANEELSKTVDLELHAVASMLHDLGWDQTPGSPLISDDRRFEVDGAFAATDFIHHHEDADDWDERRVQLVWDAIALHTTPSIYNFKEIDVKAVGQGILMDFYGPSDGVTQEAYSKVSAAFPKDTMYDAVNGAIIWLCQTKPNTTYDTWMQPFGENHVDGYDATGHRVFDLFYAGPPPTRRQ